MLLLLVLSAGAPGAWRCGTAANVCWPAAKHVTVVCNLLCAAAAAPAAAVCVCRVHLAPCAWRCGTAASVCWPAAKHVTVVYNLLCAAAAAAVCRCSLRLALWHSSKCVLAMQDVSREDQEQHESQDQLKELLEVR